LLPAVLLVLLGFVAACVPRVAPPPPVAAPTPTPAPMPMPTPTAADWQDWPVTPGTWRYERDARGSRALFGTPGADAVAVLRCDLSARAVYLSRAGAAPGGFTIRTSSTTRTIAAQPTGGTPAYVAAALTARDPLLDAIAFSRGRFTVEQPGAAPLVLRPWAEVSRVIEDCRA
jgi:hypothetical protein